MRKFLIYIICGLMTLAMFLPSIVKAADTNANETEEKVYGVEFKLIKSNGSTQYIGLLNNYVSLSNPEMPTLKEDFLNLFNSTSTKTFNPRIQRFYTFGHAYDIECYKVRTIHAEPFQDLSDIKELKSSYLGEYDRNLVIWVYAKLKTGFKVYFDPKNGKEIFKTEATFASKVKESPENPTREGYKFLGWYEGDKEFDLKKSNIYEDTTLTAKWEKVNHEKYNVKFVLKGKDIPSQEVEFDSQAKEPTIEAIEGFEFDGWYTDSDFKNEFDFSSPIKSNLTLYARWKKKKYTVSFMLEGENIPNQEVEFDSQAKEPTIEAKEGLEFDGWYTDKEFNNKFNFSDPIKNELSLYARWNKKKYTVSFVLEGKDIPSQEVEFNSQAAEPKVDPKDGFEFDGWYTDKEFKNKFNFSDPIKNELNLYARWNKIKTEKPKPDDNEESDDQKNPDVKDKPNKNNRPSYDYYDYYDYYRRPNYDYVNPNRNNSSDVAKNKDDKDEEKTKDESKDEIIEEKVTIPEAILNSYFSDIGDLPGHYQEAIIDLANRSVLIGTGKNNFDPHTSISRAMVAQVLYRLANDKAYVNPSDFTDSAPTNWFYTAVNWANEKGLVKGFKDNTFKPNKSITNEELAVILARAIEKLELKTSKINSIDKGDYKFLADWNRDGIIKMLELDLMDFTFENNQVVVKEISRAEFANIIYKLINSLN